MVFENQRLRLGGRMHHLRIRVLWCKASIIKSHVSVWPSIRIRMRTFSVIRTPNSKYDLGTVARESMV